MKSKMLPAVTIGFCLICFELVWAQGPNRVRLVFDQAHGEQPPPDQLHAIAKKLGLEVQLSAQPITAMALEGARILYLRAPSQEFTATETEAIVTFLNGGGSLLLVLDEERRQSLEKTRVNAPINASDRDEERHREGRSLNNLLRVLVVDDENLRGSVCETW